MRNPRMVVVACKRWESIWNSGIWNSGMPSRRHSTVELSTNDLDGAVNLALADML